MSVRNSAELASDFTTFVPDNSSRKVSPARIRTCLQNIADSDDVYEGGAVGYPAGPTIAVSGSPVAIVDYDEAYAADNELMTEDVLNGILRINEPASYTAVLWVVAEWASGAQDLTVELFVNGSSNGITPVSVTESGAGGAPIQLLAESEQFIIDSSMIAAGSGGAYAEVSMVIYSLTGSFTVTPSFLLFALQYDNRTIRTVG